jgi:hypothetical protein
MSHCLLPLSPFHCVYTHSHTHDTRACVHIHTRSEAPIKGIKESWEILHNDNFHHIAVGPARRSKTGLICRTLLAHTWQRVLLSR